MWLVHSLVCATTPYCRLEDIEDAIHHYEQALLRARGSGGVSSSLSSTLHPLYYYAWACLATKKGEAGLAAALLVEFKHIAEACKQKDMWKEWSTKEDEDLIANAALADSG